MKYNPFNDIKKYDEEDYSQYIKDECSICHKKIINSWDNYFTRGNYCPHCNFKFEKSSKARGRRLELQNKST